MTRALAIFNRSDCIIHAVDIGGLRANVADDGIRGRAGQRPGLALSYMSEDNRGQFLKNANELGPAFDELLDRTGLMYLLAFQPVRVPENGKFHTLKVRVKGKNNHVSARSGYYEPKSQKDADADRRKLLAQSAAVTAALPKTRSPRGCSPRRSRLSEGARPSPGHRRGPGRPAPEEPTTARR
jgi:hypothetical protein